MKLNSVPSAITLKVQEDKNEPVVLSQKVVKSGSNCTFMAMVLVKECSKCREPALGLLPCLSETGFSTILKTCHTLSCVTLKGEPDENPRFPSLISAHMSEFVLSSSPPHLLLCFPYSSICTPYTMSVCTGKSNGLIYILVLAVNK